MKKQPSPTLSEPLTPRKTESPAFEQDGSDTQPEGKLSKGEISEGESTVKRLRTPKVPKYILKRFIKVEPC